MEVLETSQLSIKGYAEVLTKFDNNGCLELEVLLVKVIYTQQSLRDRNAPKGILGRLAFFNNYYWKIASLWLAIFSGTPGNF